MRKQLLKPPCAPSNAPGRRGQAWYPGRPEARTATATVLSRLVPGPLATRSYTRWFRQVSSYLDTAARPAHERIRPSEEAALVRQHDFDR